MARALRITGVGFIVLMGRTATRVDFVPQGLSENVLTPFVIHSQIWLLCLGAACGACTGAGVDGADSDTAAGVDAGAGAPEVLAALSDELGVGIADATLIATATPAMSTPRRVQGKRPLCFFIAQ